MVIALTGHVKVKKALNKTTHPNIETNEEAFEVLEKPLEVSVKVRHGQNETKGLLFYKDNELFVEFEKPVRAPNKGQSAVFYSDDIVVGGGIIEEVY